MTDRAPSHARSAPARLPRRDFFLAGGISFTSALTTMLLFAISTRGRSWPYELIGAGVTILTAVTLSVITLALSTLFVPAAPLTHHRASGLLHAAKTGYRAVAQGGRFAFWMVWSSIWIGMVIGGLTLSELAWLRQ